MSGQSIKASRRRVATATLLVSLLLILALPATTFAAWGGWKPVPGGGATFDSPDAVSYNNKLYLFVQGAGDGLYVNVRSGTTWSGWSAVPGGFQTALPPTVVVYQGNLWVFAYKNNSAEVHRIIYDGTFWTGWAKVPLPSAADPAEVEAVVFGGRIWLFYRHIASEPGIICLAKFNGTSWSSYSCVPNSETRRGPAAVVYNKRLWLFIAGTDDFLRRNINDGSGWKGWAALPGVATTVSKPGVAVFSNKLWLFIRTGSSEIYRRQYTTSWSTWAEVPPGDGLTPSGPGATKHGDRLWLFVRGTDNGIWFNRLS